MYYILKGKRTKMKLCDRDIVNKINNDGFGASILNYIAIVHDGPPETKISNGLFQVLVRTKIPQSKHNKLWIRLIRQKYMDKKQQIAFYMERAKHTHSKSIGGSRTRKYRSSRRSKTRRSKTRRSV